ncbi:MAG: hypothetical protein JRN15_11745 [Nitrososphaerota archaeon]|nr:hypothetical protein [Nitrososphaerota archaeon]
MQTLKDGQRYKGETVELVKIKHFKDNNAAIMEIVEEYFQEHLEIFADEEVAKIAEDADKMSDVEFDRLASEILRGKRKAQKHTSWLYLS